MVYKRKPHDHSLLASWLHSSKSGQHESCEQGAKGAETGSGLPNTAVRVLHMRRDGFVGVEAPWVALEGCGGWCSITSFPYVVTAELAMPSCRAPAANGTTQNGTARVCGKDTLDTRIGTGGYTHKTCANDTDCPVSGCYSSPIVCNREAGPTGICGAKGFGDGGMLYVRPSAPMLQGGVSVVLNVETAADGFVAAEVQDARTGAAVPGLALSDADLLTGNFISHASSWRGGVTAINGGSSVPASVRVRLALNNAKVFSVQLLCADAQQESDGGAQ